MNNHEYHDVMKILRNDPEDTNAGKPGTLKVHTYVIPDTRLSDALSRVLLQDENGSMQVGYATAIQSEPAQGAGGVPLSDSGTGKRVPISVISEYDVQVTQRSNRSVDVVLTIPVPEKAERLRLDVGQAVNQWAQMLPLFIENSVKGQEAALQRAALAYQPQTQLWPADLELLEMQRNAAEAILSGTRWLSAAEVAQEAGWSASNPHALANRWKKEGKIFAIKYQGVERYPRYAFDEHMAPRPVIAEVIRRFAADAGDGELDPWDIAAWFESTNTYLDSARPRERLDTPSVIASTLEHKDNWMHG